MKAALLFVLVAVAIVNIDGQNCTWPEFANTYIRGGTNAPYNVATLKDCFILCESAYQCASLDWFSDRAPGKQCVLWGYNVPQSAYTAMDPSITTIDHYDCAYADAPNCFWKKSANTVNGNNAPASGVLTLAACQATCERINGCGSVDWLNTAAAGSQCILWGNGQNTPQVVAAGVADHYDHFCSSTSTPKPITPLPSTVNCNWQLTSNTIVGASESFYVGGTSLAACQAACAGTTGCGSLDWYKNNKQGQQCQVWGNAQTTRQSVAASAGVDHYDLLCPSSYVAPTTAAPNKNGPPNFIGLIIAGAIATGNAIGQAVSTGMSIAAKTTLNLVAAGDQAAVNAAKAAAATAQKLGFPVAVLGGMVANAQSSGIQLLQATYNNAQAAAQTAGTVVNAADQLAIQAVKNAVQTAQAAAQAASNVASDLAHGAEGALNLALDTSGKVIQDSGLSQLGGQVANTLTSAILAPAAQAAQGVFDTGLKIAGAVNNALSPGIQFLENAAGQLVNAAGQIVNQAGQVINQAAQNAVQSGEQMLSNLWHGKK